MQSGTILQKKKKMIWENWVSCSKLQARKLWVQNLNLEINDKAYGRVAKGMNRENQDLT